MRIDAHQHFWDRSQGPPFDYGWQDAEGLEPIRRTFLPEDLEPLLDEAGVERTIFVQAQHHVEETRWALRLADRHPWIAGVVGWVDLASPDCEAQLVELREDPRFVGVRHLTHDEPDGRFLLRDPVQRGLRVLEKHGVPFDLLFFVEHLPQAAELGRRLPDLPMVIDHLAKPRIRAGGYEEWIGPFREVAACPNVHCKLSGLITEADRRHWRPADLRPYVESALELFGPERCMFGSDWPVCLLAGGYRQVHESLVDALGPISEAESAAIFGATAGRFYGLDR